MAQGKWDIRIQIFRWNEQFNSGRGPLFVNGSKAHIRENASRFMWTWLWQQKVITAHTTVAIILHPLNLRVGGNQHWIMLFDGFQLGWKFDLPNIRHNSFDHRDNLVEPLSMHWHANVHLLELVAFVSNRIHSPTDIYTKRLLPLITTRNDCEHSFFIVKIWQTISSNKFKTKLSSAPEHVHRTTISIQIDWTLFIFLLRMHAIKSDVNVPGAGIHLTITHLSYQMILSGEMKHRAFPKTKCK